MSRSSHRHIVLKARLETVLIAIVAGGLVLGVAYTGRSRSPEPVQSDPGAAEPGKPDWTGKLADLGPDQTPKMQPLTSASLVVPKSTLALPAKTKAAAKSTPKPCADEACDAAKATAPTVAGREKDKVVASANREPAAKAPSGDLLKRLNPLNHIPDAVRRPFALAGDTVSGWIKHF